MRILANFLIGLGLGYLALVFSPIIKAQVSFWWLTHGQDVASARQTFGEVLGLYQKRSFGELLHSPPPLRSEPVDPNAAIVIDKISVNAPIVWEVGVSDKNEYLSALSQGVAHAKGTSRPSEQSGNLSAPGGNTYLFSHSTLNPLEIKKYSASFTLLNKLVKDDLVVVFENGVRFDYRVKDKRVVSGFDLSPLTREVNKPTLTLQTCDPPGVPLNRLIVTAELEKIWGNKEQKTQDGL